MSYSRKRDRVDDLRREVLTLPPVALPPVEAVGPESAGGELPDAQSQHRGRGKARSVVHACARLCGALGIRRARRDQSFWLARHRSGRDEDRARSCRLAKRRSNFESGKGSGPGGLRVGKPWIASRAFRARGRVTEKRAGRPARAAHERLRRAGASALFAGCAQGRALAPAPAVKERPADGCCRRRALREVSGYGIAGTSFDAGTFRGPFPFDSSPRTSICPPAFSGLPYSRNWRNWLLPPLMILAPTRSTSAR